MYTAQPFLYYKIHFLVLSLFYIIERLKISQTRSGSDVLFPLKAECNKTKVQRSPIPPLLGKVKNKQWCIYHQHKKVNTRKLQLKYKVFIW